MLGGRFTLASSLFVPEDLDLVIVPMPYNGGSLQDVPFTLVERHAADTNTEHYDAILIRRAPRLTEAETEALRLMPPDSLDLNVGRAAMCYAVTAVTVVAVVMFATTACPGTPIDIHLDDDVVKRLGPELTARKLIQVRRLALDRRI